MNHDDIKFNNKLDEIIERAGGRLYLAHLDRPALERFVKLMLEDIESDIKEWRDSKDVQMIGPYWDGYEQGCLDSIVAVKLWAQDVTD
ncbi:MAG: hypothetical protein EBZ81_15935 [Betaproteobacteria bacterium]|nr:hypothetical protein [Betaproteobacteria bacterium]